MTLLTSASVALKWNLSAVEAFISGRFFLSTGHAAGSILGIPDDVFNTFENAGKEWVFSELATPSSFKIGAGSNFGLPVCPYARSLSRRHVNSIVTQGTGECAEVGWSYSARKSFQIHSSPVAMGKADVPNTSGHTLVKRLV